MTRRICRTLSSGGRTHRRRSSPARRSNASGLATPSRLQLAVAAADERLEVLFVPREHLLDHAPGGARVEVGGSVQVRHEIVEIRSHRAAMYALGR